MNNNNFNNNCNRLYLPLLAWLAGIYLSDIAEIRGGMASHGFSQFVDSVEKHHLLPQEEKKDSGREEKERQSTSGDRSSNEEGSKSLLSQALDDLPPPLPPAPASASAPLSPSHESSIPLQRVRPDECLSIIAYERTLDLQLLDVDSSHSRDWFIDMLSLLSIKSVLSSHTPEGGYAGRETVLRLRHWRRVKTNSSYVIKNGRGDSRSTSISSSNMLDSDTGEVTLASIGGTVPPLCPHPPPNTNLHARRLAEAQLFMEILCESIAIEEERFDGFPASSTSHHIGQIESNTLWLDPNLMRIYVMPTSEEEVSRMSQVRGANLLGAIRVSVCVVWSDVD